MATCMEAPLRALVMNDIRGETTSDTKSIKHLGGHLSRAKANDFFKRERQRCNSIRKRLYIIYIFVVVK